MKEYTASKIAEFLLQIKAVKIDTHHPFTWASGWKSPVYCDNRITLSHPRIRTFIRQELVKKIEEKFGKPDLIAGVATAAIAQGVLVAEAMGLPFVYVRSASKQHGMKNLIEGEAVPMQSAVVIEDLISTGKSSLHAVEALRQAQVIVKGMVSVFNYSFEIAKENFKNANCPLYSLSNFDALLKNALETNYIHQADVHALEQWRANPETWHDKRMSV